MKKAILLGMVLGIILIAACANTYAEETAATITPAATPAPEAQEAYGEVVSVDANAGSVIITEYDYEKDEDVSNKYNIDKAATYENVKSLSEVKAGDWVALTVKPQKEGGNIATSVYVERYDMGEEVSPVPVAAPAPAVAATAPITPPIAQPAPAVSSTVSEEATPVVEETIE